MEIEKAVWTGNAPEREEPEPPAEAYLHGRFSHAEAKYNQHELYMVGRPDLERRYPIFDASPYAPMTIEAARIVLKDLEFTNLHLLPSERYRIYKVSIEEV